MTAPAHWLRTAASRIWQRRARWLALGAVWMLVWFALTMLLYVLIATERGGMAPNLVAVAKGQGVRVLLWVATAPLVAWALRRWPLDPGFVAHFLGHLGASFVVMLVNYVLRLAYFTGVGDQFWLRIVPGLSATNLWDVIIYWCVVAYLTHEAAQRRGLEALRAQASLQASLASAELRALKYQLRPHFLFNALNAVAALIREEKPDKAVETLATLSTVLRTLTDGPSHEFVTVAEEVEFAEKLLEIEQVRFGPKLRFTLEVDPAVREDPVPSFVLQPLVENAIKHGIGQLMRPGRIEILAYADPTTEFLCLEVRNDVPPAEARTPDNRLVGGVGLSATRDRLRHLYRGEARLTCDLFSGPQAVVRLELPRRAARDLCPSAHENLSSAPG